jgi:hypothetical protein
MSTGPPAFIVMFDFKSCGLLSGSNTFLPSLFLNKMLPLPSTAGRDSARGGSWSRRARFLLIPAGVLLFLYILTVMQPPSNKGGYSKYVHQQRYASYSPSASEYQIAVISDMDTKSKVSENELKWRGVLKTATLRREGKKYSVEWTGEVRDSGLGSTTYRLSYVSISF